MEELKTHTKTGSEKPLETTNHLLPTTNQSGLGSNPSSPINFFFKIMQFYKSLIYNI